MKPFVVEKSISKLQDPFYSGINKHEVIGRLISIPVSILDVTLETIKTPLKIIECLVLAIINLLGAAFSDKFTLKDALYNTERMLFNTLGIPVVVVMVPLKLLYQLFSIVIDLENVKSINHLTDMTYKEFINQMKIQNKFGLL